MKGIQKTAILLFVSLVLISSFGMNAYALSWNGSAGGGGGGGSPSTKGFAVRYTSDMNVAGYRFSVIDQHGNTKTKVIDVFRSHAYYYMDTESKFSVKYNKKQLIDNQNGSFSVVKTTVNCYKEGNMGLSLPPPKGIEAWAKSDYNLNIILRELGYWNGVDGLVYQDKLIVEPLYMVKISNVYSTLTLTELAIYGKHMLGAYSDGGSSSNSGTWGFIAGYTNKHFANWLYTPDGMGIWGGAGFLNRQATFYTLINDGYGVGVAYAVTTPTTYTINYNANGGYNAPSAQTKHHGVPLQLSSSIPLKTGHTFLGWGTHPSDTTVDYHAGSTYTKDGGNTLYAIWTPTNYNQRINFYKYNPIQNSWIYYTSRTYSVPYGSTFTATTNGVSTPTGHYFGGFSENSWTVTGNKTIDGYYYPNQYTVSYHANGGINAPPPQIKYYGYDLTLSSHIPTRHGYEFKGWGTYAGDTTVNYRAGGTYTSNSSNTLYAIWYPLTDLEPEIVEPNSVYRRGTEIIVSFHVHNDGPFEFRPSNPIDAKLIATSYNDSGGQRQILNTTKQVIVPSYEKNLVYFKVSIPMDCKQVKFDLQISSDTEENDNSNNRITKSYNTAPKPNSQTPDTVFENTPTGFSVPNKNSPVPTLGLSVQNSANWQIWEWSGGFRKNTYGVKYTPTITLKADESVQNEVVNSGITTMKSGYGVNIIVSTGITSNGNLMPSSNAYTKAQNAAVFLPEFQYQQFNNKHRSLEVTGNHLAFAENDHSLNDNGVSDNRRVHFTPLYFPNGEYVMKTLSYDVWTPMGMIGSANTVNRIKIEGSIYDDWFTTHIQ